jgi:hypothetical protein
VQVTKRGGTILVVAFYERPVTLDLSLSATVRSDIIIDLAMRYLTALIQVHRFMYRNKADTVRIAA